MLWGMWVMLCDHEGRAYSVLSLVLCSLPLSPTPSFCSKDSKYTGHFGQQPQAFLQWANHLPGNKAGYDNNKCFPLCFMFPTSQEMPCLLNVPHPSETRIMTTEMCLVEGPKGRFVRKMASALMEKWQTLTKGRLKYLSWTATWVLVLGLIQYSKYDYMWAVTVASRHCLQQDIRTNADTR